MSISKTRFPVRATSREATARRLAETRSAAIAAVYLSWKLKPTQASSFNPDQLTLFGTSPEEEARAVEERGGRIGGHFRRAIRRHELLQGHEAQAEWQKNRFSTPLISASLNNAGDDRHNSPTGGGYYHLAQTCLLMGSVRIVRLIFDPYVQFFRFVPSLAWLVPIPFYFLEVLVGLVQALVFMLLTAVFTLLICTHEEGEHPAHEH